MEAVNTKLKVKESDDRTNLMEDSGRCSISGDPVEQRLQNDRPEITDSLTAYSDRRKSKVPKG